MNILYIGTCDSFATELINKLVKENNEVNIISTKGFDPHNKPTLNFKLFLYDSKDLKADKVYASITPDAVIFAGNLFGAENWLHGKDSNDYLASLMNALNFSVKYSVKKFVYLSSTEVYDMKTAQLRETSTKEPFTYKGIICKQGEDFVKVICAGNEIAHVSLRISDAYGYKLYENKGDIISNAYNELTRFKSIDCESMQEIYPVAIKDICEAVFRALDNTPSTVYNVSEDKSIMQADIYAKLNSTLSIGAGIANINGEASKKIDCTLINKELEWFAYHDITKYIIDYKAEIAQETKKEESIFKKFFNIDKTFIRTIENMVMLAFFAGLTLLFNDHSVLSNIQFMNIAIIISALMFGFKQSIFTVMLAFLFYLYTTGRASQNFLTALLNADTFLQLAQYIFMGVAVGYVVDQSEVKVEKAEIERDYLQNEYEELKEINRDNILIKKQYEKRLLGYKTSLPKLYSITSQLDTLNPEVIFSAVVNVFKDVLETDTISVYSFSGKGDFARLVASSGKDALFNGKSFKLSDYPQLQQKLLANETYIGTQWSEESPSLAGAVFNKGNIIAIFIIKEMALGNLNLYQVNLFRTLLSLITASFIKAYQYEEKVHAEKYIEGTGVLKAEEFKKLYEIKQNDKNNAVADFSLIKIEFEGDITHAYNENANAFRVNDYFGEGANGELLVLLSATGKEEMSFVDLRLTKNGVKYQLVEGI